MEERRLAFVLGGGGARGGAGSLVAARNSLCLWNLTNLAPRARSHHVWCFANFSEYLAEREALIPWIW